MVKDTYYFPHWKRKNKHEDNGWNLTYIQMNLDAMSKEVRQGVRGSHFSREYILEKCVKVLREVGIESQGGYRCFDMPGGKIVRGKKEDI